MPSGINQWYQGDLAGEGRRSAQNVVYQSPQKHLKFVVSESVSTEWLKDKEMQHHEVAIQKSKVESRSPRGLIKYPQGLDKDNDAFGMSTVECRAIFGANMEVEGERYGPSGTIWPSLLLVGADGIISVGHRW